MDRPETTVAVPPRTHSPAPSRTYSPIPARSLRGTPSPLASHINSSRQGLSKSPSSNRLSAGSWTTTQKSVKYGRGKHSDVELVPQPSDDPEDPLVSFRSGVSLITILIHFPELAHLEKRPEPGSSSSHGRPFKQYEDGAFADGCCHSIPF